MYIRFSITKIIFVLTAIALLLIAADLAVITIKFKLGINIITVFEKFILDDEGNVPAFFSSSILLLTFYILLAITLIHRKEKSREFLYWLGLTLIFLFLAFDEAAALHESMVKIFWRVHEPSGFDNYVWPTVYGVLFLLLAAIYLKFVLSLPRKIMILFVLAAILYVGGAIGLEFIGSMYIGQSWYQPLDWENLADGGYYLIATIEEVGEIFGVLTFIFALLTYIDMKWQGLYLYVGGTPTDKETNQLPR